MKTVTVIALIASLPVAMPFAGPPWPWHGTCHGGGPPVGLHRSDSDSGSGLGFVSGMIFVSGSGSGFDSGSGFVSGSGSGFDFGSGSGFDSGNLRQGQGKGPPK